MRPELARARENSRRRRSALPYAGASVKILAPMTDAILVTLTADFNLVDEENGNIGLRIAESAVDLSDMLASPDFVLTVKAGATPVRYGNGNRARPLPSRGLWILTGYSPVGGPTP